MTREEHLQGAKERALEFIAAGDLAGAYQSFVSDMGKHREAPRISHYWLLEGLAAQIAGDPEDLRRWIERGH
jgi:hypothetical protein